MARSDLVEVLPMDPLELGLMELRAALDARELSNVELMAATLARIDAINPSRNAIVARVDPEVALAMARALDGDEAQSGAVDAASGVGATVTVTVTGAGTGGAGTTGSAEAVVPAKPTTPAMPAAAPPATIRQRPALLNIVCFFRSADSFGSTRSQVRRRL